MVIEAINLEEQLADMKATLDWLSKESVEKDAVIKRQNKHIAYLIKKLEKQSFRAFNKGSSSEDFDKESNNTGESNDGWKLKKDSSLSLMSAE